MKSHVLEERSGRGIKDYDTMENWSGIEMQELLVLQP